jgi:DNA-binding NtrC family response regulator
LAVVRFELPSLKQRREDIPYLVDHFIEKFNARMGKRIISVSPDVMSILMHHDYPGNIRELENIIEYGFVICRGSIIQVEHLPVDLHTSGAAVGTAGMPSPTVPEEPANERLRILSTLREHDGNMTRASQELGIHRSTLWRKLKRYNIDPDLTG